jgi:hypothetical protein
MIGRYSARSEFTDVRTRSPASEMHSDKNRGSVTVARILRPH